jgi:hypothetical protein
MPNQNYHEREEKVKQREFCNSDVTNWEKDNSQLSREFKKSTS